MPDKPLEERIVRCWKPAEAACLHRDIETRRYVVNIREEPLLMGYVAEVLPTMEKVPIYPDNYERIPIRVNGRDVYERKMKEIKK